MSIQGDLENALLVFVGVAVPDFVLVRGPITTPNVEGNARTASARKVSAAATRLEFSQTLWVESFTLTLYWHAATITRETSALEWELMRVGGFSLDPELGVSGTHPGLERSWVASEVWGEAFESALRTLTAVLVVERVE